PRRSWAVKLKFLKKFNTTLTLAEIKSSPECSNFALVRIGRLSVMPVSTKVQNWLETKLV
ncbi:EVE domain-containing protein, partial [Candidatus Saccharibacteria bacterium]|nr:EVE domain-containing protein [Candidatus Saccharibacteria bacterium]